MKILEIIPSLNAGGAETFVVNLSNEMSNHKNIDITLLTFYDNSDTFFLKDKMNPSITVDILHKRKGMDFMLFFRLYNYIRKNKFEIVHCHLSAISYILLSSIFYRKCKYFSTIHNDAYREASGIDRFIRRFLFKFHLCVPVAISDESNRSFIDLYHFSAPIIYNAVPKFDTESLNLNLKPYKHSLNTKLFLSAASITPHKNEVAVAKVFNKLRMDGYDVSIIFLGKVGDDDYCNQLKGQLSDSVFYLGEVSNPVDYMYLSDYFILASYYEGLPISLLEAISVNCLPVVTPVGGSLDIVKDGINGFIIPSQKEDDIYETVKCICDLPITKMEMIKQRLLEMNSKFSIQHCADEYLQLFNK